MAWQSIDKPRTVRIGAEILGLYGPWSYERPRLKTSGRRMGEFVKLEITLRPGRIDGAILHTSAELTRATCERKASIGFLLISERTSPCISRLIAGVFGGRA
jgi:hypothetical protein